MSLEELPIEVLHLIFNHLDIQTIIHSVRLTSRDLHGAVGSYNKFNLDTLTIHVSDLPVITKVIAPEHIISLKLRKMNAREIADLYLFTRLQALTLIQIEDTLSDRFFENMNRCRLRTLSITIPSQTVLETGQTINRISTVITHVESNIRNLFLDISDVSISSNDAARQFTYNLLQPIQNVLKHLTIQNCYYNEYHLILSNCPLLRTLVIKDCNLIGINNVPISSAITTTYLQLISLTLHRCRLSTVRLHFLLSFTPSLQHLELEFHKVGLRDIYDGSIWEKYIPVRLPHLKTFDFFFTCSSDDETNSHLFTRMVPTYRSPFWLNEKQWIIKFDCILTKNLIRAYTKPIETYSSEIVILCDDPPINN